MLIRQYVFHSLREIAVWGVWWADTAKVTRKRCWAPQGGRWNRLTLSHGFHFTELIANDFSDLKLFFHRIVILSFYWALATFMNSRICGFSMTSLRFFPGLIKCQDFSRNYRISGHPGNWKKETHYWSGEKRREAERSGEKRRITCKKLTLIIKAVGC